MKTSEETINSLLIRKKDLKNYAEQNEKSLVYNRSAGGYQITSRFSSSEVEYPARTKTKKVQLVLSRIQLARLYSYIYDPKKR